MTTVVGVVAALEMERRWIPSPGPLVEVSGVGAGRAAAAAQRVLGRGAQALVSWGVAGGLDPVLASGTVVLPDTVVSADESVQKVDLEWRNRLLARAVGRVSTSTSPLLHAGEAITTPEEKIAAFRSTGAGAVDMESAAVAAVADEAGVPFLAIKVVVDSAGFRLPEIALTLCDEGGRLKSGALLQLVFMPGEWPGLLALARANAAAGRSMRALWSLAAPDLALSEVVN